jgi:hypothetical protein
MINRMTRLIIEARSPSAATITDISGAEHATTVTRSQAAGMPAA